MRSPRGSFDEVMIVDPSEPGRYAPQGVRLMPFHRGPMGFYAQSPELSGYAEPPEFAGYAEPPEYGYYAQEPNVAYGEEMPVAGYGAEPREMVGWGEPDLSAYVRDTAAQFNAGCPLPTNVAGLSEPADLAGYTTPGTVNPSVASFTPQPGPTAAIPDSFKPIW